jgi:hypothetical protein
MERQKIKRVHTYTVSMTLDYEVIASNKREAEDKMINLAGLQNISKIKVKKIKGK